MHKNFAKIIAAALFALGSTHAFATSITLDCSGGSVGTCTATANGDVDLTTAHWEGKDIAVLQTNYNSASSTASATCPTYTHKSRLIEGAYNGYVSISVKTKSEVAADGLLKATVPVACMVRQ
ncbi:hypothetical protein [Caballeronia sp. Lep1P3]|uniref:hypothetical protein n=1 Tax=Caballeronia sp. Lep1P3 TaxID=2878150 RepID=UPI001FD02B16|nr:hypothetical protein [Caballeronia sp. Lep1P3]